MKICSVHDCEKPVKRLGWCNMHSARWYRTGSVADPEPPIDHFTRYTIDDNGCWLWSGPVYQVNGYGQLSRKWNGDDAGAYRLLRASRRPDFQTVFSSTTCAACVTV